MNQNDLDKLHLTEKFLSSLLSFTQNFYLERTGRKFLLSYPDGRISHFLDIIEALERVLIGESKRLIINVPPRYGKTELIINFCAWAMARYPDSNFIYTSYSHSLAKKQTYTIRQILQLPMYQYFFGIKLKDDASAKDNFETIQGGSVYAAGAGGSITGRGAGIKGVNRFGGCIIIDDIHKPDEVTSDTMREGIIDWYDNTLQSRINSPDTPIIFIGQRLHEYDLAAKLINSNEWEKVILPAIDVAGNALYPDMHNLKTLKKMQEEMPYEFAAQYQQDPQPAGGGIFKPEWFVLHEHEPNILGTFLTVDTAETDKTWNDKTVFSFWGIYQIKNDDYYIDEYALHWIDCVEIHVEPKDLENEFAQFYANCMRYKVKPKIAAIEKKSTGVTLQSVLSRYQGMQIQVIEQKGYINGEVNSKTHRFLDAQPYIAKKLISLPMYGKHTKICIDHCRKITANNSHRWDDIADTLVSAIQIGLRDKLIVNSLNRNKDNNAITKNIMSNVNRIDRLKKDAYGS